MVGADDGAQPLIGRRRGNTDDLDAGGKRLLDHRSNRIPIGRSDDDGVDTTLHQILNLRNLLHGIGIAAGIDDDQFDTGFLRRLLYAIGGRYPEGGGKARHGEADGFGLG